MKYIIGKKIDMTQIWQDNKVLSVTRVQAGPCPVVTVKNKERDGYLAVQLGFGQIKDKKITKPQKGIFKNIKPTQILKEFRTEEASIQAGDIITVKVFAPGDLIKVSGQSKGKGFQGVVKRHHFSGSKKTHGNKDQERMPGSSGCTEPQHVFKGIRKPGRMGAARTTVSNLEIAAVDSEHNLLFIKGAVSGKRNSILRIQGQGELIIAPTVQPENTGSVESAAPAEDKAEDKAAAAQA